MLEHEKGPGGDVRTIDDPTARMRLHALDAWVFGSDERAISGTFVGGRWRGTGE